tara:strand:- start:5280 stop:6350 length:1071 start_codon:yes stop_codon:yes gene_type:complete
MIISRLSDVSKGTDNNLNLIRFTAALMVLVSHSFSIVSGNPNDEPFTELLGKNLGSIAVDVFFIISGFLISKSFDRRRSIGDYFMSRFLRIYPALIFSSLLTVVLLGLVFSTVSFVEYFTDLSVWQYVLANSFMLLGPEYLLPGVFVSNPIGPAVNGSLWTLPYELRMYILIALILLAFQYAASKLKIHTRYLVLLLAVFMVFVNIASMFLALGHENFIRLSTMFILGSSFYFWAAYIPLSGAIVCISLAVYVTSVSILGGPASEVLYIVLVPYAVCYFAYVPAGRIRRFNDVDDYSYGIYIYAFPIQQSLILLLPDMSVVQMVGFASLVTLMFAILSWKLVERPSLRLKALFTRV